MAQYKLSENARADVEGLSPFQIVFFVMSSRKADATVLAANISKSVAERFARLQRSCVRVGRVQSCVRVGRVQGDFAVTLQED